MSQLSLPAVAPASHELNPEAKDIIDKLFKENSLVDPHAVTGPPLAAAAARFRSRIAVARVQPFKIRFHQK